jgi:hypothetical protein
MVDFNELMQQFNLAVNNLVDKLKAYFQSLTNYELYAWIALGVGFVLVLISLITW